MNNPYVRMDESPNQPLGQPQLQEIPQGRPYYNTGHHEPANIGAEQYPVGQPVAYQPYPGSAAFPHHPQQLPPVPYPPRFVHPIIRRRFGKALLSGLVLLILLSILVLWILVFDK